MNEKDQKKIFSKNLNYYLAQRNKTQKEVADAISVSPQTFNTWCQGIALPRMGKVQRLADYFNIEKSDLIDEKRKVENNPKAIHEERKERELLEVYRKLSDENKDKTVQYSKGLLSVQEMDSELLLNAAHARTDIDIPEGTDTSDNDIMDDDDF